MSNIPLTLTTELDAVNLILDASNKASVNTLSGALTLEVARARLKLHEISRAVQKKGWHFNSSPNVTLYPDNTGTVQIGKEVLSIDATDHRDLLQRGSRLYDRDRGSYTFDIGQPVHVKIVEFLSFEELPEAARYYIAIRAARTHQQNTSGSAERLRYTSVDETTAWEELMQEESQNAGYNMLTGSRSTLRIVNRNYPDGTGI